MFEVKYIIIGINPVCLTLLKGFTPYFICYLPLLMNVVFRAAVG